MLKMGGSSALCLLILTVFFAFSYVGCVQEEVEPASVGEDVVLGKKGDVDDLYKDVSHDCHCELRILSVSGYDDKLWTFVQDDVNPYLSFFGMGNMWASAPFEYSPLPSEFRNLTDVVGNCFHLRPYLAEGSVPVDVTFSTEVRCYEGISTSPATTTYHQFVVPANSTSADFYRLFLCRYLTNGESADCSRTGGGSQ